MAKPSKLLLKLSRRLFDDPAQQAAFTEALTQPQPRPSALLWTKERQPLPCAIAPALPWQPNFVDRLAEATAQPGRHPLHDAGYFYCLDFSSIFAASVLLSLDMPTPVVLDLCAAPGGKGLFAWTALQPEQLICNEVVGKRIGMLLANLKRCEAQGAAVLNLDPQVLAEKIPHSANLVIVDAPCSGQSLLAKGGKAEGCFHPVLMNKNANRQKRILANAADLVAGNGYLAYMTCTYAVDENEKVCRWFLDRFPQFQAVNVPHLAAYQSHLTEMPCYRLWPQSGLGAGAFTALFRNQATQPQPSLADFLSHPAVKHVAPK